MIVNRSHAEEARATLEIAPPLEQIDAGFLKSIYYLRAMEHHPDKGGDPATFVAMDRARAILELWLARQPADVPKGLVPSACARCHGAGRIKVHKGFNSYLVRCNTCNGTGDGGYDHDRARE